MNNPLSCLRKQLTLTVVLMGSRIFNWIFVQMTRTGDEGQWNWIFYGGIMDAILMRIFKGRDVLVLINFLGFLWISFSFNLLEWFFTACCKNIQLVQELSGGCGYCKINLKWKFEDFTVEKQGTFGKGEQKPIKILIHLVRGVAEFFALTSDFISHTSFRLGG